MSTASDPVVFLIDLHVPGRDPVSALFAATRMLSESPHFASIPAGRAMVMSQAVDTLYAEDGADMEGGD